MEILIIVGSAFLVGVLLGFCLYAWMFGQLVRTGRCYVKDKYGKWHPANPFRSSNRA